MGDGRRGPKRASLGASVCLGGSCSADPLSGVIWSGLLSEGKSDPSLGISTLLRCPADGQGPVPTSAGDGDLPLMSPLEPESSSSGKGGGWSPVLGQAGF